MAHLSEDIPNDAHGRLGEVLFHELPLRGICNEKDKLEYIVHIRS